MVDEIHVLRLLDIYSPGTLLNTTYTSLRNPIITKHSLITTFRLESLSTRMTG